jgi:hypothetical protein
MFESGLAEKSSLVVGWAGFELKKKNTEFFFDHPDPTHDWFY